MLTGTEKAPENKQGSRVGLVRSEGLEPPRCYSLPPQGSASTNSATSAKRKAQVGAGTRQRRRCNKSAMGVQGTNVGIQTICGSAPSACTDGLRQHLLDFDRDPVAIDEHDAGCDRKGVGQDLDFVRLGGV